MSDFNKKILDEQGYIICRNFFKESQILRIRNGAKFIFEQQFVYNNYEIKDNFQENLIRLFKEQPETFKNCGKLIQTGLIELYKLGTDEKLIDTLEYELGLRYANMCTRPVLFFNHPQLATSPEYYMTPKHQDWPSMQSSQNSLVVWVPLVDVNKENGSIIIYPGSHKNKTLPYSSQGGFATVEYNGESIQPEMKVGDICIFSTFLVHESGPILNDSIRWSAHFRYTDMMCSDFISRGYPSPYQYVPITKQK